MPDTVQPDPSPWLDIAAELRRIADDVETLAGEPAPGLFSIDIQPHNADGCGVDTAKNRPVTQAAVDAVAQALIGKVGVTEHMVGSAFHHKAYGQRGAIKVGIYQSVAGPDAVDPEQEIERLRARVAELEARDADGGERA
jgi:fumarate hydratase class II